MVPALCCVIVVTPGPTIKLANSLPTPVSVCCGYVSPIVETTLTNSQPTIPVNRGVFDI